MDTSSNHTTIFFSSTPTMNIPPYPTSTYLPPILLTLLLYPLLMTFLRYTHRRRFLAKYPYTTRSTFRSMTDTDAQVIVNRLNQLEFPFTFEKALQFALFKTYGIPSVSRLLVATSQLSDPTTAGKRYVDTEVLVREWMSWAPGTLRANEAIARMNYIHSGYLKAGKILEDDMLFTIASFAVEPAKWIKQYEWRELEDFEKCALGVFFKSIGDAMGISYRKLRSGDRGTWEDGLQWLEEVQEWTEQYADEKMVPDVNNNMTADQTVAILVCILPQFLQGIGAKLVAALMDERLRTAMMYPLPAPIYFSIVKYAFGIRKFLLLYFSPPRPSFLRVDFLSAKPNASTGRYFYLKYDAAPFYVKPTLWERIKPAAWYSWAVGLALPGDRGDTFVPQGYKFDEVGPRVMKGKGGEYVKGQMEELGRVRTGGCPFGAGGKGEGIGVKIPVGGNDLGVMRWARGESDD